MCTQVDNQVNVYYVQHAILILRFVKRILLLNIKRREMLCLRSSEQTLCQRRRMVSKRVLVGSKVRRDFCRKTYLRS